MCIPEIFCGKIVALLVSILSDLTSAFLPYHGGGRTDAWMLPYLVNAIAEIGRDAGGVCTVRRRERQKVSGGDKGWEREQK